MKIEAFVIHLARATQRRAQVERLRQALPMPSHVIDAVDGSALSDDEIAAVYKRHLYRPRYPFELGRGEIGCFLSHRKVWREIVDRGLDAGLIIEDDVELDQAHFPAALALAMENIRLGDYIRFPWRGHTDAGRRLAANGTVTLEEPRHTGLGTLGQLVGREAATRLLEVTGPFDRPVDTFIQARWLHGLRVAAVRPVCLRNIDTSLGGTTLAVKKAKPLRTVIGREIARPLYRLSVRVRDWVV